MCLLNVSYQDIANQGKDERIDHEIEAIYLFIYLFLSTGKFLNVLERIETWILYSVRCYMPGLAEEGGGRIKVTFNLLLILNIQLKDLADLAMMGC